MNLDQIKSHVTSKLQNHRVGGYSIEQLWHGIHPDNRGMVAVVLAEMLSNGRITVGEKRVGDGVGNWDTVPSYRLV